MSNADKLIQKLKEDKALAQEFIRLYRQNMKAEVEKLAQREGCPCTCEEFKRAYFDKLSDSELKGSFEQSAQGASCIFAPAPVDMDRPVEEPEEEEEE